MRVVTLVFIILLMACTPGEPTAIYGTTMGTTYSVKIVDELNKADKQKLKEEIEAELQNINKLMSTYISDSELSRFNHFPIDKPFKLSKETAAVITMAQEIFKLSQGMFDVTVGPLVNLWGFGPDASKQAIPSQASINTALTKDGMNKLQLSGLLISKSADIYVDLSAIAKGYGVDRLAALLKRHGIENYLVEIGGELRAKGLSHRGDVWRVAIERPDALQGAPYKAINLKDMGMATSGDYRNYFELGGKRYSHTINPVTGKPITHKLASVSVVTRQTAMADGFATAINVMGAEAGMAFAEENDLAVLLILKSEDGFVERVSSEFAALLSDQPE